MAPALLPLLSLILTVINIQPSLSQTVTPPPPPCNSIQLQYTYTSGQQIPPNETDPTRQPYSFKSTLTITNNGLFTLKSWRVFVGFRHRELLVSHSGAVLVDVTVGSSRAVSVGNGTVVAGFPVTDLPTAIDTAGDLTQYSTKVEFEGTQFGVGPDSGPPMPGVIRLANDGFICPKSSSISGNGTMEVCCTKDPNFKSDTTTDDGFLPRQNGDLSIMYDIESTHDLNYDAQVTIENHHPLGRLDYWKLSWDWLREEFINSMRGAYTDIVDSSDCIYGPQGQFYKETDFFKVLNCKRRPTLIDLPLDRTNDTIFGMVPNCCRNGTILPKSMDPKKSKSVFKLNVQKMPPDTNRSELSPPQDWKIEGLLNPDYVCGPPVRVSPSQYPDSSGLPVNKTVVASWQVVCNITKLKGSNPKCCVSFSAFYNESVIPCKTCACGCATSSSQACSATSPALLLPSQALLVPFDNRTKLTQAWADLKHLPYPNPLPCGDNCGVSINWHLYSDYKRGWTSRVTIFNWDETPFADWFAAVEMGNATLGFEKAYSFNGTAFINGKGDENNTIFLQGLPGLNYIVAESDDVKDPLRKPRVPGKQQSVLSFTKKKTPGISVVEGGDGFPKKVYFNGEECSLPSVLPTNSGYRNGVSLFVAVVLLLVMQQL